MSGRMPSRSDRSGIGSIESGASGFEALGCGPQSFQGEYRPVRADPRSGRALFLGREGATQSHGRGRAIPARPRPSTGPPGSSATRAGPAGIATRDGWLEGRRDRPFASHDAPSPREDRGTIAMGDSRAAKPRPLDVLAEMVLWAPPDRKVRGCPARSAHGPFFSDGHSIVRRRAEALAILDRRTQGWTALAV